MVIPQLSFGGAQRDFSKLSVELAKQYKVYVCIFNREENIDFPFGGFLIDLSVEGGGNIFQKTKNFAQRTKALNQLKRQYNIHTTISYLEGANYINILSRSDDQIIISARGSQLHDETITGLIGWLRRNILIKLLYPKADKIVALNYGIKKELTDNYKISHQRIHVIKNYFDITDIQKKSSEGVDACLADFFNNFVICTAGRLAPEKGYNYLIDIVSQIRTFRDDVKLLIIGDGGLKYELFEHASQSGLHPCALWDNHWHTKVSDSHLLFAGFQANPFKYIAKSNLFAITSSSEGGPNILSEAMICHVPVISVDCPSGPREKISTEASRPVVNIVKAEYSKYGILMPVLNQTNNEEAIQEWVQVILKLIDDKKILKRYAERASQMMSKYDISLMSRKWEKMIQSVQ